MSDLEDYGPCHWCGSNEDVSNGPDPYAHEINDDPTPVRMYAECRRQRADDV